jgi:hypothetical protein
MILHRRDAKDAEKNIGVLSQKPLRLCGEKLHFNKYSKQ